MNRPKYSINVQGQPKKILSPEEVQAHVMKYLMKIGLKHIGATEGDLVISVPANFNQTQIEATKKSAEIAGWNVLRVITEPVAAGLAYMHSQQADLEYSGEMIIVYDFGGGKLDVAAVNIAQGQLEVITIEGNSALGGQDIDQVIIDWLVQKIEQEVGIDCRE